MIDIVSYLLGEKTIDDIYEEFNNLINQLIKEEMELYWKGEN